MIDWIRLDWLFRLMHYYRYDWL